MAGSRNKTPKPGPPGQNGPPDVAAAWIIVEANMTKLKPAPADDDVRRRYVAEHAAWGDPVRALEMSRCIAPGASRSLAVAAIARRLSERGDTEAAVAALGEVDNMDASIQASPPALRALASAWHRAGESARAHSLAEAARALLAIKRDSARHHALDELAAEASRLIVTRLELGLDIDVELEVVRALPRAATPGALFALYEHGRTEDVLELVDSVMIDDAVAVARAIAMQHGDLAALSQILEHRQRGAGELRRAAARALFDSGHVEAARAFARLFPETSLWDGQDVAIALDLGAEDVARPRLEQLLAEFAEGPNPRASLDEEAQSNEGGAALAPALARRGDVEGARLAARMITEPGTRIRAYCDAAVAVLATSPEGALKLLALARAQRDEHQPLGDALGTDLHLANAVGQVAGFEESAPLFAAALEARKHDHPRARSTMTSVVLNQWMQSGDLPGAFEATLRVTPAALRGEMLENLAWFYAVAGDPAGSLVVIDVLPKGVKRATAALKALSAYRSQNAERQRRRLGPNV